MEQVSIRALKSRLSHYLRLVRTGHSIQITDKGEVVAELLPPAHSLPTDDDPRERLEQMARHGLVRLGAPNHPGLYPTLPRLVPPGTAKRLLDEERGER